MKRPTLKVGRKYSRDPHFYGVNTCDPFTVIEITREHYCISNGYFNNCKTSVNKEIMEDYLRLGRISLIKNKDIGLLKIL